MIDKNKAYRFRGDSERWEWHPDGDFLHVAFGDTRAIGINTVRSHIERGILLEYPELPGDDWEFCESEWGAWEWNEVVGTWREFGDASGATIYCRKKKPVYRSGAVPFSTLQNIEFTETVYWTTDPEKGKELLS